MVKYVPLTREMHAEKSWKRVEDFRFAAQDRIIPILEHEAALVAGDMPLGFVKRGDLFELVALVSLHEQKNLYVGPGGSWLVHHKPALLRAYPFRLLRPAGSEKAALCFDEESSQIQDNLDGEAIFADDGKPSKAIQEVLNYLQAAERNRTVTQLAVAALDKAGIITPWEINVTVMGKTIPIAGLHKINLAQLNTVDGDTLLSLRNAGALSIAYCQIISVHQVATLTRLIELHKRLDTAKAKRSPSEESIREMFKLDDGNIQF